MDSAVSAQENNQSDVDIAARKAKSIGTVGIRKSKVDHQWVMEDLGSKINNKISRETRTFFA